MDQTPHHLRLRAQQCRDLASTAMTPMAKDVLSDLANKYETDAALLERQADHPHRRPAFDWTLA